MGIMVKVLATYFLGIVLLRQVVGLRMHGHVVYRDCYHAL